MKKLKDIVNNAGRTAVLVGSLAYASGCGLGAYSGTREGILWDAGAQGAWDSEVSRENAEIQAQGMRDAAGTLAGGYIPTPGFSYGNAADPAYQKWRNEQVWNELEQTTGHK